MNSQDRQRVKEIFTAAVRLPEQERVDFVHRQAEGNLAVVDEALSLLRFHCDETLLESSAVAVPRGESATPTPPDAIDIDPATAIDPDLILQQVWKENSLTLRRRLMAISLVMATLIAISMARLFTFKYAAWGYGSRLVALIVTLGCAWILYRGRSLTFRQIRLVEWAVMSSTGLLAIAINLRLMLDAAGRSDAVMLVVTNQWNHMLWALLILVYGTFMPNTWRQAAAILFPVALIPYVVTWWAQQIDPSVGELLTQDIMGTPIPITLVAAGVSVFAAHLIHDARLGAIQARYLSQYRIVRIIGSGGMGQVFEAEHRLLKRPCAIKLIRAELAMGESSLQRFQNEVRATALLTHPNTIQVYDYGLTRNETFFYAMELLPGKNLNELVRLCGALPPRRVVHFLCQVCGALREAHAAGLVHRDVKPANIFASQRGGLCDFVKLLDFGLVRQVEFQSPDQSTRLVQGTPRYMSPEQILNPNSVDPRSDLYALGCVGYYLLTGRLAFDGSSPLAIMQAQIESSPRAPSSYQSGIPEDLEAIIMRCLEKDPDRRFQSAQALQESLAACSVAGQWSEEDAAREFARMMQTCP